MHHGLDAILCLMHHAQITQRAYIGKFREAASGAREQEAEGISPMCDIYAAACWCRVLKK